MLLGWKPVKDDLIHTTRLEAARVQAVHGTSWQVFRSQVGQSAGAITSAELTGEWDADAPDPQEPVGTVTAYVYQIQNLFNRRQEGLVGTGVDMWRVMQDDSSALLLEKGDLLVSVDDDTRYYVGPVERRYGLVWGEVNRS